MKIFIFLLITLLSITGCNNNTSEINYETNIGTQKIYGEFYTNITDKTPERLNNIELGVNKLNGIKVKPGETFSFNETIGPRTPEKGYKEAIIFDGHGNKIDGYGGGICQISSTLYNAVLNAGLEVTERHEHSHDVPYIEKGKDATVSYGSEDFKFKNNTNSPLTINSTTENDTLYITIQN